jgi:hypothetical protein
MKTTTLPGQIKTPVNLNHPVSSDGKLLPLRWTFLLGLCVGLAGCSTPETNIVSQPPGAMVMINGVNLGVTPIHHQFDFKQTPTSVVIASKPGYHNQQQIITRESSGIHDNQLAIVLSEDEAYKVTTTSDADNSWLRVQVDPSLSPDVVWQKVVDSVTSRFPSLEMLDAASGYMRSVYVNQKFKGPDGDYQVRTRFICSISSKTPLVYKLKIESELSVGHQDWIPYDRVFKEDAQLVEELQGRLGVK